jgi:hypothetical protein
VRGWKWGSTSGQGLLAFSVFLVPRRIGCMRKEGAVGGGGGLRHSGSTQLPGVGCVH